jgi:hypothetical protein
MQAETNLGHQVNYPLFLSDFNQNWNVQKKFNTTFQHQILSKIFTGP